MRADFLPDFPSASARSRPNARTPGPGGGFTGSVAALALQEAAAQQERARAQERHGGSLPGPLARTLGPAGPVPPPRPALRLAASHAPFLGQTFRGAKERPFAFCL